MHSKFIIWKKVWPTGILKGKLRSRITQAQRKEREKCQKKERSLTSMRQMVLEISHLKVRNLSRMDVAIL